MTYAKRIADQIKARPEQVNATIELLDAGNTIPFIARYRKEATSSLDEEQIRTIQSMVERLRELDERRATVMASIEEQGKMTPELNEKLLAAETMTELEDLYQPYKPKRRTRASIAREKGLQPLADLILQQPVSKVTPEVAAQAYLSEVVTDVEEALAGGRDIVAEMISDHAEVRQLTREKAMQWGVLGVGKTADAADERKVYQTYYEFEMRVDKLRPHQVLAINRGEEEKVLRVKLELSERDWHGPITTYFRPDRRSLFADQLNLTIEDAAERLLLPAIERDVRRSLTEQADRHAIHVFGLNLRALLSQPPLEGYVVLGIDPGFRTGCKLAVVDPTGKLLTTGTIYPHEPQKRRKEALETLAQLCQRYHVTLIAIGNGTASRESEQLAAELIKQLPEVKYIIVSEAGASVYSASPLARAEMPDLDVSLRGAVSIARRIQDPLAELVKIDPKSIGVGLYQHDVDQAELAHALDGVVESVVNNVGVDVNTASPALLTHVSGIGPKLAEKIVAYRDENGRFMNRAQLKKVSGLGAKAFEQSAGFMRVRNGDNPLDASAIHPESYAVAKKVIDYAGIRLGAAPAEIRQTLDQLKTRTPVAKLAAELGAGEPTLVDIFDQLVRPGRDPRKDAPEPILRSDILSMEDLTAGTRLKGTVRNVVDFGAFVDIGVKTDGLLHRSQVPFGTMLQVGDIIDVEIQSVDTERHRIALTWATSQPV
ncbi:MAG: RNA-binding transcriptional accessory protein [Chloroflexi bacterium]|nr:Tex family protein [Anaerolineaceae bacterium]NMB86788.1 RNA-binding transcriptional accessory protein [Chloroflexota bacterium]